MSMSIPKHNLHFSSAEKPRKSAETTSNDTEIQQALLRDKPKSLMSSSVSYDTPLVDFLAKPDGSTTETIVGATLGVGLLAGLFSFPIAWFDDIANGFKLSLKNLPTKLGIALGGVVLGALLGCLGGFYTATEEKEKQQWTNDNILKMVGLTSTKATLAQGNKALQKETGATFTQQSLMRSNEETAKKIDGYS